MLPAGVGLGGGLASLSQWPGDDVLARLCCARALGKARGTPCEVMGVGYLLVVHTYYNVQVVLVVVVHCSTTSTILLHSVQYELVKWKKKH